ncbi:hypothetical protein [Paenibacillus rhizolycopersici]|uniref:hypothetical protein n=1 Tax=Paenibacillus rhizolycopersici TaxID=2780073 RepID=UPI003D2D9B03
MTREEIQNMNQGTDLNLLVAEHVMKWIAWKEQRGEYTYVIFQRPGEREPYMRSQRWKNEKERYEQIRFSEINRNKHIVMGLDEWSNDIPAAFEVIKRMREKGYDYVIESLNYSFNAGGDLTHVIFFKRLEGDYYEYDSEVSVMHGISICALLAVLGEEE